MPRRTIPVNRERLEQSIQHVEKDGPLKEGKVHMAKMVEKEYNKRAEVAGEETITFSVVLLRITQWGLSIKTSSAKGRGNRKAVEKMHAARRAKGSKPRSEKLASHPDFEKAHRAIDHRLEKNGVKDRFEKLAERVKLGSLSACMKMNCLECCAYQTVEIRKCGDMACPFWLMRPYQKGNDVDAEDVNHAEDTDDENIEEDDENIEEDDQGTEAA